METISRHELPIADGDWWRCTWSIPVVCSNCGEIVRDRPAVMSYEVAFDDGGLQALLYPNWKRDGWLLWIECANCGWSETERSVTLRQIEDWNIAPWRLIRDWME